MEHPPKARFSELAEGIRKSEGAQCTQAARPQSIVATVTETVEFGENMPTEITRPPNFVGAIVRARQASGPARRGV